MIGAEPAGGIDARELAAYCRSVARYTKNPTTKRSSNPPIDRADVKKLREGMRNRVVWQVAHGYFEELTGEERDILAGYVRTQGKTDWVFLEEGLSATLDDFWRRGSNADRVDLGSVWNTKLSMSGWDHQGAVAYLASFAIVIGAIRMQYPGVMPPLWFQKDVWPLLIGTDTPPADVSMVLRDALESGADTLAIQTLLAQGGAGVAIFWNETFFATPGTRRPYGLLKVQPPEDAHYLVVNPEHDSDAATDPHEAIGVAVQFWKMTPGFTCVKVSTAFNALDGTVIFAIAASQAELDLGLRSHVV